MNLPCHFFSHSFLAPPSKNLCLHFRLLGDRSTCLVVTLTELYVPNHGNSTWYTSLPSFSLPVLFPPISPFLPCLSYFELTVGAGEDVGRSCILVTIGGKNIVFDMGPSHLSLSLLLDSRPSLPVRSIDELGMHMGYNDERRFPDFGYISRTGQFDLALDAVIISHLYSLFTPHGCFSSLVLFSFT